MLMHVDKESETSGSSREGLCCSWILDGRAFIIRRKEELVKKFLTLFFRQTKFPSFTRKLYRWGFRQVSFAPAHATDNKREMIFGHEFFQRDNKALMGLMRSVTAAGKRRAMQAMSAKLRKFTGQVTEGLAIEPKGAMEATSLPPLTLRPPPGPSLRSSPLDVGVGQRSGTCHRTYDSSLMSLHSTAFQETLISSHQLGALCVNNNYPKDDSKYGCVLVGKGEGGNGTSDDSTAATDHCGPQHTHVDSHFPSAVAAAHEQIRSQQSGRPDSALDPNAFMRNAVDLLLRYAS